MPIAEGEILNPDFQIAKNVKAQDTNNRSILGAGHEIINNPISVKAAIGGRAAIGFPFKNFA